VWPLASPGTVTVAASAAPAHRSTVAAAAAAEAATRRCIGAIFLLRPLATLELSEQLLGERTHTRAQRNRTKHAGPARCQRDYSTSVAPRRAPAGTHYILVLYVGSYMYY
jgi:hypothetical protein